MIASKFLTILNHLQLDPFDTSTAEGREKERYRLALWASLANFFSTGITTIAMLVTVPLTLGYLGSERFGIWMTIASISALMSFIDLGIGNSLIRRIASAHAAHDAEKLHNLISTGIITLTAIGFLFGFAFLFTADKIKIEQFIKLTDPNNIPEIKRAIDAFIIIFLINIPLSALASIFQGLQMGWKVHLIKGVGATVSLLAVVFAAKEQASICTLILTTYGIQTIFLAFLFIELNRKKLFKLKDLGNIFLKKESFYLLQDSWIYFLLQITGFLIWNIDTFIIATKLGVGNVTSLAICQRIFQAILIPVVIFNAPLWAAYANAQTKNDIHFIAKTLKKSSLYTSVLAMLGIFLIFNLSEEIFNLWLKNPPTIDESLLFSYGIFIWLYTVGIPISMYLNGMGEIKIQLVTATIFCLLAIPLKFILISDYGTTGLISASIIAFFIGVYLPYATIFRENLKKHLNN